MSRRKGLVFRGGLNPDNVDHFLTEYGGVRTVTIQSAFRYDYSRVKVKEAIKTLEKKLPRGAVQTMPEKDVKTIRDIIKKFEKMYQVTLGKISGDMTLLFEAVPRRRERRQHIGLLAYGRTVNNTPLPRTINFTAGFYSLGVPPEFIGLGRSLKSLSAKEIMIVHAYYKNLRHDAHMAGRFINYDNLRRLALKNPAWSLVEKDISLTSQILGVKLGPKSERDFIHANLTSNILLQRKKKDVIAQLITQTGKLRQSLG